MSTKKDTPLYQNVLAGISSNVKMGPFKATSGIELPYYLNASTNFLDKNVAPLISEIISELLNDKVKSVVHHQGDEPILCCGMETAGGILASQLCQTAKQFNLADWMDFVYIRKEKKSTGTQQQLEGPQKFTSRTNQSPLLKAIWVDDVLSTGSSMYEGIQMLKREYNVEIIAAVFLVDRSKDRINLAEEKQFLKKLPKLPIFAVYDLQQVDDYINAQKKLK